MKLVLMGTPDFAVPCLKALLQDGNEIAAVFTQPDKPKGRGYIMMPPPVKVEALAHGIPVYQPDSLKGDEVLSLLREISPDMIVVVAYGKILPRSILELPRYGCVNIHASLLPEYRGAAPIQQAVLDGCRVTGVTAQQMDVGLDTGDILMKAETAIGENETADELHDRLSLLGADLIVRVVHAAAAGALRPEKQDDSKATYVGKLTKEMARIDFSQSAAQVHNLIRGLYSWPCAVAVLGGKRLKLLRSRVAEGNGQPGQVLSLKPFVVACGTGAVELLEVQPEGKKKMDVQSFLNGLHGVQAQELHFE